MSCDAVCTAVGEFLNDGNALRYIVPFLLRPKRVDSVTTEEREVRKAKTVPIMIRLLRLKRSGNILYKKRLRTAIDEMVVRSAITFIHPMGKPTSLYTISAAGEMFDLLWLYSDAGIPVLLVSIL
jgi:hypothetical protein